MTFDVVLIIGTVFEQRYAVKVYCFVISYIMNKKRKLTLFR